MATSRAALTAEDFFAMPGDDSRRYDLLDGELIVSPAPLLLHQRIVRNLMVLLDGHIRAYGLGEVFGSPTAVILSSATVVEPDVVYVSPDRVALLSARGIEGAPALHVEVLSPSTRQRDRNRRFELYARHGVPYHWIVETDERAIEAYELVRGAYRLARRAAGDAPVSLPPFPALSFAPESLWRP